MNWNQESKGVGGCYRKAVCDAGFRLALFDACRGDENGEGCRNADLITEMLYCFSDKREERGTES